MFQRILVPVDGSPTSNQGLTKAIELARMSGGQLHLLHVVDDLLQLGGFDAGTAYSGDVIRLMHEAGQKVLDEGAAQARQAGIAVEARLLEPIVARVAEQVVRECEAWKADLIVIGTHGRRGVGRMLMGSDAEQIARLAPVPVLLVRSPEGA